MWAMYTGSIGKNVFTGYPLFLAFTCAMVILFLGGLVLPGRWDRRCSGVSCRTPDLILM